MSEGYAFGYIDQHLITLSLSLVFIPTPVIPPRPVDYDPDLRWDEETGTWLDIPAAGGGRYKEQLVLIGDAGEIYVGDI
jgi:hypothetical protein